MHCWAMILGREPLPLCLITHMKINMKAVSLTNVHITLCISFHNPPHKSPHKAPYYKQCISFLCHDTQVESLETKHKFPTKTILRCFAKRKNYFYTYSTVVWASFFLGRSSFLCIQVCLFQSLKPRLWMCSWIKH